MSSIKDFFVGDAVEIGARLEVSPRNTYSKKSGEIGGRDSNGKILSLGESKTAPYGKLVRTIRNKKGVSRKIIKYKTIK